MIEHDAKLEPIHAGRLQVGDLVAMIGHYWTVEQIEVLGPLQDESRTLSRIRFSLKEKDDQNRTMDYLLRSDSLVLVPANYLP